LFFAKHAKKELGQHPATLISHMVNNPLVLVQNQWCNALEKNYAMFILGSVIAQRLVGPIKQVKQIIQIEHNNVKNLHWPEANS